ncbi:MAG: hypothetical protein QXP98_05270 [Thermoproteus sp.]
MQSIELVVVGFILAFFIAVTFYMVGAMGASQQTSQAGLNVLAQQILQKITSYTAYSLSNELGIADPNTPGYVSDYIIDYLAMASPQATGLPACYVFNTNSQLASAVGQVVYWAGYGYIVPNAPSATLNLTAIARNLFGQSYKQYDVEVRITPLVRLAVCPYVVVSSGGTTITFKNAWNPICNTFYSTNTQQGVYVVAKGAGSQPTGQILYTVYYCTTSYCYPPYTSSAQLQPLSGYYSYAQLQLPSYINFSQIASLNATLVIYVQKVTYPYSATFYVFNATSISLIYGAPFITSQGVTLYLIHDADYTTSPNSNVPCDGRLDSNGVGTQSLGIRTVTLYTGQGLLNIATNVNLDPGGSGSGSPKVQQCSQCSGSSCTACWIDLPPGTMLALAYVTANAQSNNIPQAALVPIPLFPSPPLVDVDVKTWLRWGFQQPPQVYAASAWGIFNSITTTYLVNVTVYEYPGPLR